MPRCNKELEKEGCLCFLEQGHDGEKQPHKCHCEIYGTAHGVAPTKKLHGILRVIDRRIS